LLLPFLIPNGDNFRFVYWGGDYSIDDDTTAFYVGLCAKAVIFVRFPKGWALRADGTARRIPFWSVGAWAPFIAGALAVGLFTVVERGVFKLLGMPGLWVTSLLILIAIGIRHLLRVSKWPNIVTAELSQVVSLAALFAAYFYFIRVSVYTRQMAEALFAALVLSAMFVSRIPNRRNARHGQIFLLIMGVLVSGWATLAWTAHRLEWGFLYEWMRADLVEKHVGLLSPLLLGRFAIPVLIARMILRERVAEGVSGRAALRLVGVKVLGLAMLLAGIGYISALSNVYLEAVEEGAIFFLLLLGLRPTLGEAT
jgi:hypothetical protein